MRSVTGNKVAEARKIAAEKWWALGEKTCSQVLTVIDGYVADTPEFETAIALLCAFAPGAFPENMRAAAEPEAKSATVCPKDGCMLWKAHSGKCGQ